MTQLKLESSVYKAILHSKRANLYYLEYCRIMQKDGRVLYLTEAKKESQYFNIPIANTTCLLLGSGTSITQGAMRLLAAAGVLVGFTGGGGTPLFMGNEIEWLTPQNEYRPTEYVQNWLSFWFDEEKRFTIAKQFQQSRSGFIKKIWKKDKELHLEGLDSGDLEFESLIKSFDSKINEARELKYLLSAEAHLTKQLYKYVAQRLKMTSFSRNRESNCDLANQFLNHGNYLAYGLAATTLWVLGIPHGFAVMHGKTRRGALVFDVADLIKDAIVLPWAFICAKEKMSEQQFRQQILLKFTEFKALDFMFEEVKTAAFYFANRKD